jgi:formylglycine-generating enzyme required for sulfatase activity
VRQGTGPGYGTLSVKADAPGAEILLDGGLVGRIRENAPTDLTGIPAGTREIVVRDFSGREDHKQVVVRSANKVEVTLSVLRLHSKPGSFSPLGKNLQGFGEYWRAKDKVIVVRIPAGEFLMGSLEKQGEPDERPQHRVHVSEFLIDKTEVTWRQFKGFSQAAGAPLPTIPIWGTPDDYAVTYVDWDQAKAYCEWVGGRLPTEAEWEKAARGTDGRQYAWGERWDPKRCNSIEGGPHRPEPVGSFPDCLTPYGVLDMAGSVWEWCADFYGAEYYASSPKKDPTGPTTPDAWNQRVLRGGSWLNQPTWLRPAYRHKGTPSTTYVHNGLRCVHDAKVIASISDGPAPTVTPRAATQPRTTYGTIAVVSDVKDGELDLDGGMVGRISKGKELVLKNVRAGERELRVRPTSGPEIKKVVRVEADRTLMVALDAHGPPENGLVPQGKNAHGREEYRRSRDGAVVVSIPGGEFLMGNKKTEREPLEHRVYVSEFVIDKTEVTWGQYKKFARANAMALPPDDPYWGIHDDHPAAYVTWEEGKAYCEWVGARLPTETEWERAARGDDGRMYPWGNEEPTPERAVFRRSWGYPATDPAGAHPSGASPYGVLDMGGNQWEYCADWYDEGYYATSPARNPKGPATGRSHVVRGGSWDSRPSVLSVSCRNFGHVGYREGDFGFRCAADGDAGRAPARGAAR